MGIAVVLQLGAWMVQFIRISEFGQHLYDQERSAEQAEAIMQGIWESRSAGLSDTSQQMPG